MGDSDEDTSGRRAGTSHFVGGEELRSLSCLLPRKRKKGKLFPGMHWIIIYQFYELIYVFVLPSSEAYITALGCVRSPI